MEYIVEPVIYSVSEISRNIRNILESSDELNRVWVKGEISNLTMHSSGHIYFSLKDASAVISVTFFRSANKGLKFKLEEGQSIFAFGSISVFEKRGTYQLNVYTVKLEGVGKLQIRIEQLKKKLLVEGIFDPARKKALPFLPGRIGIVTSPTGAAVRDIIKVALRRFPNIEIIIAPAKVQGDDAADTIVRAIEELNRPEYDIDVIIAGRGGGSFEDLMPFNEEAVVRAFYNSRVPIISAVGHQVDHPLSDDAADYAAPTPSAAAEIAVPEKMELKNETSYHLDRIYNILLAYTRQNRAVLDGITGRRLFQKPGDIIFQKASLLLEVEKRMTFSLKDMISYLKNRLLSVRDINLLMGTALRNKDHDFNMALNTLHQLSPLGVLQRGFAVAVDDSDRLLKNIDMFNEGDNFNLLVSGGSLDCKVNSIRKGETLGKKGTKN